MSRFVLCICLIIYSLMTFATPQKIVNHGNGFSLERPVVLVADKGSAAEGAALIEFLRGQGADVSQSFLDKMFRPRIKIHHQGQIDGVREADALRIRVSSRGVVIEYTSKESLAVAMKYFRELVKGKRVTGCDIIHWGERSPTALKGNVIDATKGILTLAEVEKIIKRHRAEQLFLRMVTPTKWALESASMKLFNPRATIYPAGGYYRLSEVKAMFDYARRERVDLVLQVDLLAPNDVFSAATGHSIFSVEGMRLVRAMLEEWIKEIGCKSISLGVRAAQADDRYVGFVREITEGLGVNLIIIEE